MIEVFDKPTYFVNHDEWKYIYSIYILERVFCQALFENLT